MPYSSVAHGRGHWDVCRLWRLYLLVALLLTLLIADMAATRAPASTAPPQEVGNTFVGFGSANWSWGRYPGFEFAISFIAQHSKPVTYMWLCWKTASGYAQGNCGTWTFEIQTDNPQDHSPSGTVLARIANVRNLPDGYLTLTFPNVPLVAGTHYHLVMYNTDPHPDKNWSSPNTIMSTPDLPWNGDGVMSFDGTRWTPWGSVDNPYAPRQGGRAAYQIQFSDNTVEGMPYYSATQRRIYAANYEGEQFTWSPPDTRIGQLGFPLFRIGTPAGALQYVLETTDGVTLSTGSVTSPGGVSQQPGWRRMTLHTPVLLQHGVTYRLSLRAPACLDEANCYATYLPYSSEKVPGWQDLTWGTREATSVSYTPGNGWTVSSVPADLSFSMVTAP